METLEDKIKACDDAIAFWQEFWDVCLWIFKHAVILFALAGLIVYNLPFPSGAWHVLVSVGAGVFTTLLTVHIIAFRFVHIYQERKAILESQ